MINYQNSFDLHVLGMPPAFTLSQDQTLRRICAKPLRAWSNFRGLVYGSLMELLELLIHKHFSHLNVVYQSASSNTHI